MPTAGTPTATNTPLLRSLHHLREQLSHLRTLGPIPVIVVESPAGSKLDQDSLATAGRSLRCDPGDHPPRHVFGSVDQRHGIKVSVHLARELDTAWAKFLRVAVDARRAVSDRLVGLRLLPNVSGTSAGSWIVDVARTLEKLDPADPCPVRLCGGAAQRWIAAGRFLVDEPSLEAPAPLIAKLLVGATADRLLLLDDAVEASIAVLDLLVDRLEAVQAPGERTPPAAEADPRRASRGKSSTAGTKPKNKRGRNPNRDGDRREDRAAFWMFEAVDLVPSGDELRNALDRLGPDPKPRDVYEALRLHGLEISLDAVRNKPPRCWPRLADGTWKPCWSFADYAVYVNVKAFERYLRTFRRTVGGEPDPKPRAASPADVPRETIPPSPAAGPSRSEIRTRTVVGGAEKIEEALGRVNTAMQSGVGEEPAWEALRSLLVKRWRMQPEDADRLMGARDRDALERISVTVVRGRKAAGDTGDRGKKKRPA